MLTTSNGSLYTVSIVDAPPLRRGSLDLLQSNAIAAINYLGEYIRWKGSLDFVIRWDTDSRHSWSGNGFASYGGFGLDDKTYALSEAITGIDSNGSDFDAGTWISPGNDSITSYGEEIFLDPSPNPKDDDISNQTDFLSIFLHEIMHSLGMWSTAQHGQEYGMSSFDKLTFFSNNNWYFDGLKTNEIYGSPLPLASTGSRDHYSDTLPSEHDLVREFGFREKWQITDIDLAILHDLGVDVIKWQDVARPVNNLIGTSGDDSITGGWGKDHCTGLDGNDLISCLTGADSISGGSGNDILRAGNGMDVISGGTGADTLYGGFGLNTFQDEADGEIDTLFFKSDQWVENWVYNKSGNSPNGEKADKIVALDKFDKIFVQGINTQNIHFENVKHHSVLGERLDGIGIYASGFLEAVYVGGSLNINELKSITHGIV